jgi:hypothetical protein
MPTLDDAGASPADRFTVLRVESATESVALVGVDTDEGFEFRVERRALNADAATDAEPVHSTWVSTWREAAAPRSRGLAPDATLGGARGV